MDAKSFKAPHITLEEIRVLADNFREKKWGSDDVPVDVLSIVEFELGLEIRTISNLKETSDIDALLLGDLKTIVVDTTSYMDDRFLNRIRFSFAHEVGHLVLHKAVFREINHSTVEEWIQFTQLMPDKQYWWIEQHAHEFAGRLLVPRKRLKEEFKRAISMATEEGFTEWDKTGDTEREYIARGIARPFAVSEQVINKRLIREKLWPPTELL